MTCGVLLLAAGVSRRFGSDKRNSLLIDDKTLLDLTLSRIDKSGLPLLVCLRASDLTLREKLNKLGVSCCSAPSQPSGMGDTIAAGISSVIDQDWNSTLVSLADMPAVTAETYRLLAQSSATNKILVPVFHGQRGNPVCFGSNFYLELSELAGEVGARKLVQQYADCVYEIECDDSGILLDVDDVSSLQKMRDYL
ncbi:MAG: nucleotidyltransferase family protein [Pseudomonadales bacterium]